MLFSGQGVGIRAWISALVELISYHVPTPLGRGKCEMVAVQTRTLFGASVGKALELIVPMSASHVSSETWCG